MNKGISFPLRRNAPRLQGFTLFEMLIALAIIAIALAAAMKAAAQANETAYLLRQKTLAGFVLQNRIATHAARGEWPDLGSQSGRETQAGISFLWREEVASTPNPLFRKIFVQVFDPADENHQLAASTAFLMRPLL